MLQQRAAKRAAEKRAKPEVSSSNFITSCGIVGGFLVVVFGAIKRIYYPNPGFSLAGAGGFFIGGVVGVIAGNIILGIKSVIRRIKTR